MHTRCGKNIAEDARKWELMETFAQETLKALEWVRGGEWVIVIDFESFRQKPGNHTCLAGQQDLPQFVDPLSVKIKNEITSGRPAFFGTSNEAS